jgi:N-acetylated-alpha-linked acidic dipeptidase
MHDQVANAARFNASGAIIYTDPKEYAPDGTTPDKVYPQGVWMPPTGVQRGTIYTALGIGVGDPQTPALPSIQGMYRRPLNESQLPSIPAQPISYGDAVHFLKNMKGLII